MMPGLSETASGNASTSVVKGKRISCLCGLQIGSRHLARLSVALELETDLLTFDEFAHAGALHSRNVNECVGVAVIRLDEAKPLVELNHFTVPVVIMNPFKA